MKAVTIKEMRFFSQEKDLEYETLEKGSVVSICHPSKLSRDQRMDLKKYEQRQRRSDPNAMAVIFFWNGRQRFGLINKHLEYQTSKTKRRSFSDRLKDHIEKGSKK